MTPSTALAPKIVASDAELEIDLRVQRLSREFGQRIVALVNTATITVTDTASCESAVALRQTIGAIVKEIETGFEPNKAYYWTKHKEVCAAEHELVSQLLNPKNLRDPKTIDGKLCIAIQDFTAAEDRRRHEQEERDAADQRRRDEALAAEQAAALEQQGQHELAAAIVAEAIAAPAPIVTRPNVRTEVKGLKTKRYWRWRFTGGQNKVKDILKEAPPAILQRVMRLLPREFCEPSVRTIDDYVDAMKDKANIPGIDVYYEDVPVR